jgi:hypothetical protein
VSFRRIPSPSDAQNKRNYVAVVDVFDLPDLSDWRQVNVRDSKETGSVPKAIRHTLDEDPHMFLFMNRGLVITADSVSHDPESSLLSIAFRDPARHGLLDGGHSYTVIKKYCDETDPTLLMPDQQAYVRVELLEGFSSEEIFDIVEARNTSNQVKDQSLLELQQKFEGIKSALSGKAYADLIAYKEYEVYQGTDENGKKPKPIDVRDIVAFMTVFNKDLYGDNKHPVSAYSGKKACLDSFRDNPNSFEKIYPLLPEILELWDVINACMRDWYEGLKAEKGEKAKFGRITGVQTKPSTLHFLGGTAEDTIPTAFAYPILGALRSFVVEEDGVYKWGKGLNPKKALMNGLGQQLTDVTISNALEFRNPTKQGKTVAVWDQCYSKAQIWYLKA